MANRLVAERRRFTKPMRLEGEDLLLPDFILSDTRAILRGKALRHFTAPRRTVSYVSSMPRAAGNSSATNAARA